MKQLGLFLLFAMVVPLSARGQFSSAESTPDWGSRARGDTLVALSRIAGPTLHGWIVREDEDAYTVLTPNGSEMRVVRGWVISVKPARGRIVGRRFWRNDPNYARLLYAPSGRPLRQWEGNLAVHFAIFPSVAFGITDNVSVLAGGSLLADYLFIVPSVGFSFSEGLAASVGAFYIRNPAESGGIAYGAVAFGPPHASITVGAGYPYAGKGRHFTDTKIVGFGLKIRVAKKVALVSENWFLVHNRLGMQFLSGAVRVFPEFLEGLSIDLGLLVIRDQTGKDLWLPWATATYSFGQ